MDTRHSQRTKMKIKYYSGSFLMKIHAIGIILLLANPCFAADDNKLLTPSQSRYTGLKEALGDFNKRRIQKSKAFEIQKGGQICPKLPEQFLKKLTALKAVSYTHLDVYKRQVLNSLFGSK